MSRIPHPDGTAQQLDARRRARTEARADFLVRMLQGTMALEAQGLPERTLEAMKREVVERLLARDE